MARLPIQPRWSVPVSVGAFKSIEMLLLVLTGAFVASAMVRFWPETRIGGAALGVIASSVVAYEALRFSGAYRWERLAYGGLDWRRTLLAGAGSAVAFVCCMALVHPIGSGFPAGGLMAWGGSTFLAISAALILIRVIASDVLRGWLSAGQFTTKVAVVGEDAAAACAARLGADNPADVAVVGQYSTVWSGDGIRGDLNTLMLDCRLRRVDAVVLAPAIGDAAQLTRLRALLRPCVQDVFVLAESADMVGPDAKPAALGTQALLLVSEGPLKDWKGVSKDVFDRVCAALLLLLIAPLLGIVAVLIKLESPGPILFRQLRVGYNNQLFSILKFRTMHNAAADRLAAQQTLRGDPRVTRIGGVLRKLSIDELPQLVNVLRGDMSLVGPRPHAPGTSADGKRVQELIDEYPCRHRVKPGITGLAQVRGFRGGMHTTQQVSNRLEADLEYIRRQSVWLDIKIMVMTVMREARSTRAF